MAVFQAFTGVSMPNIEVWYGTLMSNTATTIVISDGFRETTYSGSFTYSLSGVNGTVDSIVEKSGGSTLYTVEDMDVSASALYDAIQLQGDAQLAATIIAAGDDIGYGSNSGDTILAFTGDDYIDGKGGNDRLYDGKGNDTILGSAGNDYVRVGGGVDSFDGGEGTDYISYYDSSGGITADLAKNTISGSWGSNDAINSFEGISGSKNGGDNIRGTSGANVIKTYGGNDRVEAGKGSDRVELGSGNDYVRVGGGKETFDGGSGKDYISYYDSKGGIRIDLRDDEVSGSWAVNDKIEDFESASGSKVGNDSMLGTSGSNTLKSYGGDDTLYGRGGSDKLYGGSGEDFLDGGGGSGTDLLYGGADADAFHFDRGEGVDIVKDFENNIDTIELDNFGLTKSQAFSFADQVGDDVIFDFGADGHLTIEDTTIARLQNDLEIV